MTKEAEFITRWDNERTVYEALGAYLKTGIERRLSSLIAPIDVSYFLKIPATPRSKQSDSLVEKAFYRGKSYTDPYEEITDKIGLRFVVLLGRDIQTVEEALRKTSGLTYTKDRDYEEEQSKNPIAFDYAAVHYVVRLAEDTEFESIIIPAGMPCEIQIKTLLQHSYSELTHDTIYKAQIEATSEMRRNAAKSMALLEATNDYFEKVADSVNEVVKSLKEITTSLSAVYRSMVGFDPKPTILEGLILAGYEDTADEKYLERIRALVSEKPWIIDRIKQRVAEGNPIFRQPSVLLVYLNIAERKGKALDRWVLTPAEMVPLLTDMGEGIY